MDFLKSFIFPLKMRRFRNMSVFVAISIFIICTYLAVVPITVKYRRAEASISKNGYLSNDFTAATSDFDYNEIKAYNYEVDSKNQVLKASTEDIKVFIINATVNEKAYTFNFVFDLSKDKFNQSDDLYDLNGIEKKEDSCLILFAKNFYHLQNVTKQVVDGVESLKVTTIQGASYRDCAIDFASYQTTNEMLKGVGNALALLYGSMYITSFTLTAGLMFFVLPLVIITVMWLLLRKNGSLKKFKEYYNIASISMIVPTLVAFGVAWFWPQIINFFTTAFVMYYLFNVWRINALPLDYTPEVNQKTN